MSAEREIGRHAFLVTVLGGKTTGSVAFGKRNAKGAVRAVANSMEEIGSEKALVRSGPRQGSWVSDVRHLIEVSPDHGACVYENRGDLLQVPR